MINRRAMLVLCLAVCVLTGAGFAWSSGVRSADTLIGDKSARMIEAEIDRRLEPLMEMWEKVLERKSSQSVASLQNMPGWEWVESLENGLASVEAGRTSGDLTAAYEKVNTMTRQGYIEQVRHFLLQPLVNRWGAGDGNFNDAGSWQDSTWIPGNEHEAAFFDFAPPAQESYRVAFNSSITNNRAWIGTAGNIAGKLMFELNGNTYALQAPGKPDDNSESLRVRGSPGTSVLVYGGGTLRTRTFTVDDASFTVSGTDTVWQASKTSSQWSRSCRPVIGNSGTGRLSVQDGARAILGAAAGPMYLSLGESTGGRGIVEVSGAGSEFEVHYLEAGNHAQGTGEITVRDGGNLLAHWGLRVGSDDGGPGILTVDGGSVQCRGGPAGFRLLTNSLLRVTLSDKHSTTPPVQASRTVIQGGVFELELAPGFECSPGDEFTIISVAPNSTIQGYGRFRDLPDKSVIEKGNARFQVSYSGGANTNSFTLTVIPGT